MKDHFIQINGNIVFKSNPNTWQIRWIKEKSIKGGITEGLLDRSCLSLKMTF